MHQLGNLTCPRCPQNPADASPLSLPQLPLPSRKKSVFRSVSCKAAPGVDGLWAAMDALDQRILAALAAAREANAAGLGRVRGLSQSKSGRLRPSTAAAASGGGAAEEAGEDEAYSPRALLGAEAADRPDKFLHRLKFSFKEPAGLPLHEGGCSTPRGRLEGNAEAAGAGRLIAAMRTGAPAAAAGGADAPQVDAPLQAAAAGQPAGEAAGPLAAARPGGVRWGATEGGLDRLGWVRNLVQFTEYKQQRQLLQPQRAGEPGGTEQPAAELDMIGWLESGAGLQLESGASGSSPGTAAAGPGQPAGLRSREEVVLLQAWLQDMMGQVVAQACGQGAADAAADAATAAVQHGPLQQQGQQGAADLADAALWCYGMAFEELQRQVGTECGDRGALLGGMWQHVFSLVELRYGAGAGAGAGVWDGCAACCGRGQAFKV